MFPWKKPPAHHWNREMIEREKWKILKRTGPWTAHNIALKCGITTMDIERNYDTAKVERCLKTITEKAGKPMDQLRILDLACLEGMYGIECARKGATVVGIEIRAINIAKAKFAKKVLGLENISLLKDDVRNISPKKHGIFDIILMTGILYHIDKNDQLPFLQAAASMCSDLLYIDTHIALMPDEQWTEDGLQMHGTSWEEFSPQTTRTEREKMLWASFQNPRSFKLSLPSLHASLNHVGFKTTECLPPIPGQPRDRIVVIAKR